MTLSRRREKRCPADGVLGSLVDGELDSATSDTVLEHLAKCGKCASAVEQARLLKARLSSLAETAGDEPDFERMWLQIRRRFPADQPSPKSHGVLRLPWWNRVPQPWRLAATGVAVAATVGIAFLLLVRDGTRDKAVVQSPGSPVVADEVSGFPAGSRATPPPEWGNRLKRWGSDARLFLIEASLVCERAGTGSEGPCEGLPARAKQLAAEGAELAELMTGDRAALEGAFMGDVVSALEHLAAQPLGTELGETASKPLIEMAVNAVYNINMIDLYWR
jgi:hypothetical protein